MKITIQEQEKKVTVFLEGKLDTSATGQVEKELKPLLDYEDSDITIDCSGMNYISSSGLRILLALNQRCRVNRNALHLCGITKAVEEIFTITGFIHLFDIQK